ncbi:MAG: DUF3109 family protein [Chitinophagales bacterium]
MIVIDDILISDDVIEKQFVCDLKKCKGACCIEGDGGAPLEVDELKILEDEYEKFEPYMTEIGKQAIAEQGKYVFEKDDFYTGYGTPLIGNTGACAYVNYDEKGVALCSIEQAFNDGKITFRKPISCHLYPVRIKEYKKSTAVNYETWNICSDACTLGAKLKVPTYVFVKDALIRKFGEEFYEQLDGAAQFKNKQEEE